ncbi:MAG: hypothetical protein AB8G96_14970 [Phycisphaerales bacterium]
MSTMIRARFALGILVGVCSTGALVTRSIGPAASPGWHVVQTQANVFTMGRQQQASLARWADGTTFTVWTSRRQEGGTSGIFGRLIDPQGVAIGEEVHVNQTLSGQQDAPSVAIDGDGDAWVVWASADHGGGGHAIRGRRFGRTEDEFVARGDEFVVNTNELDHHARPAIAVSEDGALVVWTARDRGQRVVTGRWFNADGIAETDEFEIASDDAFDQGLPAVAAQTQGRFVVSWAATTADGTSRGIRAQRVGRCGERVGHIIIVTGGSGDGDGDGDIEPSIDCDDDGRFAIAWMSAGVENGYGVRAQRFDAIGRPLGDRIVVAPPGGETWRSGVAVAMSGDGRFTIAHNAEARQAFTSDGSPPASAGITARSFDVAGRPMGPAFRVGAPDAGPRRLDPGSNARRLVRGADGVIAAAWCGGVGTDASGVGVGVQVRSVPSPSPGRSDVRVHTSICARPMPLGQLRQGRVAPVRNQTWTPPGPGSERLAMGDADEVGFIGFQSRGWDPADADIAVGPNQLVVVVNQAIRFYDKDGTLTLDQDISGPGGFWEEVGAGGFVFDPVALYDRSTNRFIVAATERLGSNLSLLCVAVSDDADPNGAWNKYRYDLSGVGGNIDFPNLGVGPDAIFITTDFFDPPEGNWVHTFPKQAMIDGAAAPVRSVRNHTGVRGHGSVKTYDADVAAQYFVTPYTSSSSIQLVAVRDPLGEPTRDVFNLAVPTFSDPPDAVQRGSTNRVETVDRRFKHGVYRDRSLWLAHTIGESGTARVRWYEVRMNGWPEGGVPELRQVGTLDLGPGDHTYFPAIDVDVDGNMALAFNRSSSAQFVSVERAFRLAGDALGTLRAPVRMQVSLSPELGSRWGDYNGLEEDPVEPSVFWSHTMFRTDDWRTWVGRFNILDGQCPADVDASGVVDFADLLAVLAAWGPCEGCGEDVDQSGAVDFADLLQLLSNWGVCGGR